MDSYFVVKQLYKGKYVATKKLEKNTRVRLFPRKKLWEMGWSQQKWSQKQKLQLQSLEAWVSHVYLVPKHLGRKMKHRNITKSLSSELQAKSH